MAFVVGGQIVAVKSNRHYWYNNDVPDVKELVVVTVAKITASGRHTVEGETHAYNRDGTPYGYGDSKYGRTYPQFETIEAATEWVLDQQARKDFELVRNPWFRGTDDERWELSKQYNTEAIDILWTQMPLEKNEEIEAEAERRRNEYRVHAYCDYLKKNADRSRLRELTEKLRELRRQIQPATEYQLSEG